VETVNILGIEMNLKALKKMSKKNFLKSYENQFPKVEKAWSEVEKLKK